MPVPLTVPSPSSTVPKKPEEPSVLSYFAQRRGAGYIGLLLPPVVLIYDKWVTLHCLPGSISASYHTGARDVFVGSLCAVGVFLIGSIGYPEDKPWSIFAGIMAIVVAFVPTRADVCSLGRAPESPDAGSMDLTTGVHTFAACTLFLTFAYFCLFLFTRTQKDGQVKRKPKLATLPAPKRKRNIVFIACGWSMIAAMAVCGAWIWIAKLLNTSPPHHMIFVIEWICLWAFAFAWLVKGQQLFKDAEGDGSESA